MSEGSRSGFLGRIMTYTLGSLLPNISKRKKKKNKSHRYTSLIITRRRRNNLASYTESPEEGMKKLDGS